MANEVLIKTGTAIIWANTGEHAPGSTAKNNLGARTVQIDLAPGGAGLPSGDYQQGAKADFGATRARLWEATGAFEPVSAPTAGGVIALYIGWSASATAGQDNPGFLTGADANYNGYGAAAVDATECISQLEFIGSFNVSADAAIQVGNFWTPRGVFIPRHRYGSIVVRNNTSVAFAGDAIEMSVRLSPIIDEIQ